MKPARVFISYARGDDPRFVRALHRDLVARARATGGPRPRFFFDRQDMPSRGKSFLLEIRDFIGDPETERLLLVVGPRAAESEYVGAEWRAALQRCVIVVPLLRLGRARHQDPRDARLVDDEDYGLIPAEIRETRVHAIDFRERRGSRAGRKYADAVDELWRVLAEPTSMADLGSDVPDLPGSFVPRAEYLTALDRLVLPDAAAPVTVQGERRFVALTGMGGVGKSVLASAFCRACKTRRSFKDGIAWVRMGSRPKLPTDLVDVLGPSGRAAGQGGARAGLADLSCLIVLDNVTDSTHVTRFKNALGESGRLLITTRDGAVATALRAQRCDVDLLSDVESRQLLADWSGHEPAGLPPAALDALAECGKLPLAVAMIGAMMKGKPPDRWVRLLSDLRNANLDEIRHRFPNYDHPDLLRAFKVSVDGLEGAEANADGAWERKVRARRRYLELAIFPGNTPLPSATLEKYWAPSGVDGPLATKLADLFVDRSLAHRDDRGRLVLHDLQADYLVSEQRGTLEALHRRFLETHRTEGGWHAGTDDGYLFGHLADHLRGAGWEGDLAGLVSREWMEARLAATGSHRGFADDVEAAIAARGPDATAEDLVDLTRMCLALGTVTQLASGATPSFIGALARVGQVDKAIHNASLMIHTRPRVFALGDVAVALIEQGGGSETARRLVEQILRDVEGSRDRELELLGVSWAARCLAELRLAGPAAAAAARALALLDPKTEVHARVKVLENVSRAFQHLKRAADARRVARRALEAARGSEVALLRDAAVLLVEVGDEPGFVKALSLLRDKDQVPAVVDSVDAVLLIAEALDKAGQRLRAAKLVDSVRAAIPDFRDVSQQAVVRSSAAITLAHMGRARQAEALVGRALQDAKGRARREAATVLGNAASVAIALGQGARAARLARRALAAIPSGSPSEQLTSAGVVAELLSEAGQRDEAVALLEGALAATWTIRDPWPIRDTAGILGEALIRAGKLDQGLAQVAGLADTYGTRARAQARIAVVLAETGAWDRAVALARSMEPSWHRSTALRGAALLARHGAPERVREIVAALDDDSMRALCLCETVAPDDEAAVRVARAAAREAGSAEALGILAERLAAHGSPDAGREVARQAFEVAASFRGHSLVSALGDLARPFLLAGAEPDLRRVDARLRDVEDTEYRAEGRLRLALALAQAGQAARAHAIVKNELARVERLEGRDVPRATMLAAIALTLLRVGAEEDAVSRARQALVALDRTAGGWNSDYDKDLARSRAVTVLTETARLAEAFAAGEVAFQDLAQACAEAGDLARARHLLTEARRRPEGEARGGALAWAAWTLGRLGRHAEARPVIGEALRSARFGGRTAVLAVVETTAHVIASIDAGETLIRLCETIREVESWWASASPELR